MEFLRPHSKDQDLVSHATVQEAYGQTYHSHKLHTRARAAAATPPATVDDSAHMQICVYRPAARVATKLVTAQSRLQHCGRPAPDGRRNSLLVVVAGEEARCGLKVSAVHGAIHTYTYTQKRSLFHTAAHSGFFRRTKL